MKKSLLPLICFLLAMQLMGCSAGKVAVVERPMVVAHRGGASLGPENSLMAIERAITLGVDAVEVDVRLSADGHVVVMHDKSVNRTTDGKGRVDGLSLAQLKGLLLLDAAGNKTDERIPTLDEVFGLVAGRCSVLIEIKDNDSRGIESAVVDAVARNSAWDWVAVHSFSDKVLERFNLLGVPFPLEKLFVFKLPLVPYIFDGTLRRLSLDKYDYVSSFNVHKCFARDGLVVRLHDAGKGVKLWTFGKDDAARPVNADGVIVDSPQLWLP